MDLSAKPFIPQTKVADYLFKYSYYQPFHFEFTPPSLPKLKLAAFSGDPIEWPEWSSAFTAMVHNAPILDSQKISHLNLLLKGKAKAVVTGMGFSEEMYQKAWEALERYFSARK